MAALPQEAPSSSDSLWERLRYGPLLARAARGTREACRFARLVARVEYGLDSERRRVACARIRRWLGVTASEAARLYRASLYSEALEEADTARLMRLSGGVDLPIEIRGWSPRGGRPRIYGALHAGSPVFAFMGLRAQHEPHARIIARELDDQNPMARVKHEFARRKVAWVEDSSGARFFDTDATSILAAREHLLAGRPLFAAVDVPGDVVDRDHPVRLFDESVVLAEGIFHLAAMTGADMQILRSVHRGGRILVDCRPPIEGADAATLMQGIAAEMEAVIREQPEEFWFWPFFVGADREAG